MMDPPNIQLHWVQSLSEANEFMSWLGARRPWLAVDTETGGFDWWVDPLRTVQFGDGLTGWCLEWDRWAGLVHEALGLYDRPIAMHNAKFDTHFLEVNGVELKRWLIHDTRAMAHILNPAILSGLKPRSMRELGAWAGHGEAELKEAMVKGGWDWATVPIELIWKYAAFDTCLTALLAEEMWPKIVAQGFQPIYELELASTQVLTDMERRGILTDRAYLREKAEDWGREKAAVEHVLTESFGVVKPGSAQQVMRALEQESGWRPTVFTEKGSPDLSDGVLGGLAEPDELGGKKPSEVAALVRKHREYHKLTNTYVKNLLGLSDDHGRLHPSINPLGAKTGRMSVTRPALQTLPSGDPRIRNAFISGPGNCLITADYDQIEMRLFAHYSGDELMLQGIRYGDWMSEQGHDGYDLHSMAARLVFGIGMNDEVPKALRKRVKGVSFGKVYGSGLETFAATSGLSLDDARHAIAAYEQAFPQSRKDQFPSRVARALAERDRYNRDPHVLTSYGRKEPCWPSEAYKAVNYLIQGTAADVLKDRIVALSRTWVGELMILPIHDEILFEVPDEAAHDAMATIRETMPERERFAVPLTVDAEIVRRWGDKY